MRSRKNQKVSGNKWKWTQNSPKPAGPERDIHSDTSLPKMIETFQTNKLTRIRGKTNKPRVKRRKEIIKIRVELNDIEINKTIQRMNKFNSWFFGKINKIDKALTRLIQEKKREDPNE